MFINQPITNWTPQYWDHIQRNIGIISFQEQEKIRTSKVAVLGVGGLGGTVAENLVRAGCQNLIIADRDTFDASNLNRQLCTLDDIDRSKVDVVEEFLQKIDSEVKITKFSIISPDNIDNVLEGVNLVALTLDGPITSILIERECRKRGIPMCETWAVPMLFSWWFFEGSKSYEDLYDLPTQHLSNQELYELKDQLKLTSCKSLFSKILIMLGVEENYDREPGVYEMMMKEQVGIRSFAPIVRLTADYLVMELIFAGILRTKSMTLAPEYNEIKYF
jgi:molybdopterin/thiamine biosynthesis adenylyltransferase